MTSTLEKREPRTQSAGFFDRLLLNMKFRQKGFFLVAVPLIFEIVFVLALSYSYAKAEAESRRAEHGRRVLAITDAMTSSIFALGASLFVDPSTNPQAFESRFKTLELSLESLAGSLWKETKEFPDEAKYSREIASCLQNLQSRATALKAVLKDPLQMISKTEFRNSRILARESIHKLAAALDQLVSYQEKVSGRRLRKAQEARRQLNLLLYLGVAANTFLCIWLSLLFSAQITRRLALVSRNAVSMSKREAPAEILSGNDELAELDELIHKLSGMLIESTRREKALIDNTFDVILSLTSELRFSALNAACKRQWGWEPELLIGSAADELVLAEQRQNFKKHMDQARKLQAVSEFQCSIVRQDSSILDSRWSVLWSEAEQSYFAIVRDIGEELRSEQMRKQFFSMLTHDLRTPITNVKLFTHMLEEGEYGELNQAGLKRIAKLNESLDFLSSLTNDLLDLSKMQSKGLTLSLEHFNLDILIDECCAMVENLAQSRKIKLDLELDSEIIINGDFLRLKQVLANFLTNAIKFSPLDSSVRLKAGKSKELIKIAVIDSGKSLSPEDCKRLFEPFEQTASAKNASIKGFGLGLSIAKNIVEAHSGRIGVELLEEGTCFWFELPAAATEADDEKA